MEQQAGPSGGLPVHLQQQRAKPMTAQEKAHAMAQEKAHAIALEKAAQAMALESIEQHVQQILRNYVEPSPVQELFQNFIRHTATDELTVIEVLRIFRRLDANEKERIVQKMVEHLQAASSQLIMLDQVVTKILFALYEKKVVPILPIAYQLINTLDMKFRIPIDSRKVRFVREHLHEIGYKGMRDLIKLILFEKLDKLPSQGFNEFQRFQLISLEELMLDLLDRRRNLCPPLFVITELTRLPTMSAAFMLPRLLRAIRESQASFRPLAEVNAVIGRSWLYPLTAAPIYSWFGNSWKLTDQFRVFFKTHLPFTSSLNTAQTNFLYMLLKQPRGQLNLHQMIRRQPNSSQQFPFWNCSEMLHMLIMEATSAMETTALPIKAEANQYNWRHIFHLVSFALCTNCGSFSALMDGINAQLKISQFKKARGELMWMILQYVSIVNNNNRKNVDIKLIVDVFNSLYPDEMCWTGSSDDTWEMTRFFAPASIWMLLSNTAGEESQPPEKLIQLLEYLKGMIGNGKEHKPTDLALIANAYSNSDPVFLREVVMPILKRLNSATHYSVYPLPYGIEASGELECLEVGFLEALTFHAKQSLWFFFCQQIQHSQDQMKPARLPSPALIETIARIALKAEPAGQPPRSSTVQPPRSFTVFILRCLLQRATSPRAEEFNLIFYDLFVYRLKNALLSVNKRVLFINCAYEEMPELGQLVGKKLPQYVLMEQAIMRQFMVAAPYDLLTIPALISQKSHKMPRFNLFASPAEFHESPGFSVCPEVTKLLLLHYVMAYKLTADYPNEKSFVNEFMNEMNKTHKWPRCSLRWFPAHIKAVEELPPISQQGAEYAEGTEEERTRLWNSNALYEPHAPTTFIMLFDTIFNYTVGHPAHVPAHIKSMPIRNFVQNVNALVKYLIQQAKRVTNDDHFNKMVRSLHEMIFGHQYIPFERFLLALILHPNDNESIKISLIILDGLLKIPDADKTRGIVRRLEMLYKFLPSNANLLHYNSQEFFKKMADYRREFGDYDFEKLDGGSEADPNAYFSRVPMYYSNLAERLLPVVDVLFLRCYEVGIEKHVADQFLKAFAPLYRYHPQPITFLYKLTYILDGLPPTNHTNVANPSRFVAVVCKHLEDDKHSPRYPFLTHEFAVQQHNMPTTKICRVLTDRVVAASTYTHQPPDFVARDWRIAEFPPATQALISACVELMVSPKDAREVVEGLIRVSMSKPVKRPTDRLNAVALLLCNLPKRFQNIFYERVEESFSWNELKENGPDYLFSSYNVEIQQYREDKIMSMLALMHAFIQHANADTLAILCSVIGTRFAPRVENETQLIYYIRILTVYLMKIIDREKDSFSQYLQLIHTIYDMIPRILQKQPKLQYEDLICDLLYGFKYTVPGSTGDKKTEEAMSLFPEQMREKLKFLPSPGMRDIANHLKAFIPHAVLAEIESQNFRNTIQLSDIPLMTNEPAAINPAAAAAHGNAPPNALPHPAGPPQPPPIENTPPNPPMPVQQTPSFPNANPMAHGQHPPYFPPGYANQMGQGPPQPQPHMMHMMNAHQQQQMAQFHHHQQQQQQQSAAFHNQQMMNPQMPPFSHPNQMHPAQQPHNFPSHYANQGMPPNSGMHGQGPHPPYNFPPGQQPYPFGGPHGNPAAMNRPPFHPNVQMPPRMG